MNRLFLLLMLVGILFSCDKNDDNEPSNQLNGEWNLVSVSCECVPVDLETGDHIWTFDLANNELNVVNNVTEQLHTILETGTYDITFSNDEVVIENIAYDYYFVNETLFLADHPESDGPLIEFVRD